MFKRIAPLLCVLLAFFADTAVVPVFYDGVMAIPLSLCVVLLIGMLLGRMRGMLYGMIAGLLQDITAGTVGMKVFPYVAIGFVIGFMLYRDADAESPATGNSWRQPVSRAVWVFVFVLIYEIAMLVIQYFSSAIFTWVYMRNLLQRSALVCALTLVLYPLFRRMFYGKTRRRNSYGRESREVKNY